MALSPRQAVRLLKRRKVLNRRKRRRPPGCEALSVTHHWTFALMMTQTTVARTRKAIVSNTSRQRASIRQMCRITLMAILTTPLKRSALMKMLESISTSFLRARCSHASADQTSPSPRPTSAPRITPTSISILRTNLRKRGKTTRIMKTLAARRL